MNRSSIHPLEVEGPAGLLPGQLHPAVRMDDVPGKPGTRLGLVFRFLQFICATITVTVMASTNFTPIPAFNFLFAAASLLCAWSLSMGILDVYALFAKRRLRCRVLVKFFTIGDGIIGAVIFTAACMSGGTSYFISSEMNWCAPNVCHIYRASSVFAFFSFFPVSFSFFLNLSSWASIV